MDLGDICEPEYGYTDSAKEEGNARFIRITDIDETGKLRPNDAMHIRLSEKSKSYLLKENDVLVARTGATYGKTVIFKENYPAVFASYLIRLNFKGDVIDPNFYWVFSQTEDYWAQAKNLVTGGGQPQFNGGAIKKIKVPLPPIKIQKQFVFEAEKEQEIIEANRRLIEIYEKKIQGVIGGV